MIDQRLRAQNAYLTDMDRRIDEASRIRSASWFSSACSILSSAFADALISGITAGRELRADILKILAETIELRLSELSEFPVPADVTLQVVTALTNRQYREAGNGDYLIGWSLADALGMNSDPSCVIMDVAMLTGESDVRLFAFYDGLERYLSNASSPLVDAFFLLVDRVASNRFELVMGGLDPVFTATEEAWSKETDLVEVWRGRQWDHFHMYSDELSVVHALRQRKPDVFVALCDRLLVPPLTEAVLGWPAIAMDFDTILRLLAIAPTVEKHDVSSWNRSLVAPVLLEVGFRHLIELGGTPVRPLAGVEEVSSLARLLWETCLTRTDGHFLIVNWSRHLIRLAGTRNSEYFDGVFSMMVDVMAEQGVDATTIGLFANPDVPEEGSERNVDDDGWSTKKINSKLAQSFDYFMIAALVNGSDATRQKVNLRSIFQRQLCAKNPSLWDYGQERLPNWRHYTVAKLYFQENDPVGAWSEDWATLATQRREAVHWSYRNDRDTVHPSLFLANVGVGLIEWMVTDNEKLHNFAAPMWKKIFESVLPFAIHWSLADDKWRSILQALFARYPNAHRGADDVDVLWQYLDGLGGDDLLFTVAVVHVLLNGVRLDSLIQKDGGESGVVQRIQAFLDWDELCGGRSVGEQIRAAWSDAVKGMDQQLQAGPDGGDRV
ncbi:hypothetical protein QDD82_005425 [Burkholderia cepacia]|uniref:hypothetical protein n=1 Tax=Burkholderia cepacia complex TaxID=87882 RepID=UPI00158ABBDE|nr:hypothetical protein [Burkholderia cenocepacia]EKS9844571.1 hypothetical protein [Burkholderia cepacia]